jgi:hypothetical protein
MLGRASLQSAEHVMKGAAGIIDRLAAAGGVAIVVPIGFRSQPKRNPEIALPMILS